MVGSVRAATHGGGTGSVRCWGHNHIGQLGLGDSANRGGGANEVGDSLPNVDLRTGRTATSISAG